MSIVGVKKDRGSPPERLNLSSPNACRTTIARLIRAYHRGTIDETAYKGILFGLNTLLAFYKFEKELDMESRLDALEQKLVSLN